MEGVPPMHLVKGRQQAWGTTGKRPQTPKPAAGRLRNTCHGEQNTKPVMGKFGNCRVVPTGYQKHDRTPTPSVELRHRTWRPCGWSGSHCYVPMLHSHLCCRSRAHKRLGSPELEPRFNHPVPAGDFCMRSHCLLAMKSPMMGFVANHAQNEVMSLGMTIISEEMHHVKTGMMQLEVGVMRWFANYSNFKYPQIISR